MGSHPFQPFSSDGHRVAWSSPDASVGEHTTIHWENEGFTVSCRRSVDMVEYVLRYSASWQLRQFLLFRDLEEPDLWLATDGRRWGEMNGAHRIDLDGSTDVLLPRSPTSWLAPLRRLHLDQGQSTVLVAVVVNPETLDARRLPLHVTRQGEAMWVFDIDDERHEFTTDEFGLPLDVPNALVRATTET
jgi:hypothetical protein